ASHDVAGGRHTGGNSGGAGQRGPPGRAGPPPRRRGGGGALRRGGGGGPARAWAGRAPARSNGSVCSRIPVAARTALATAGAIGGVPGSPTPEGGFVEGTMCTSIARGMSLMRSTWYWWKLV